MTDKQASTEAPWCLVESEPGIFSEMMSEYGVTGLMAEELWTLDLEPLLNKGRVHGLIFTSKYEEELLPENHQVPDPDAENVFYACQVIVNVCATLALLGIIMNCHPTVDIGKTLSDFKDFTQHFDPINRGLAIGSHPTLQEVHNRFASPSQFTTKSPDIKCSSRKKKNSTWVEEDTYHFIAYIEKDGFVWELDGLKRAPIKIGKCTQENWLEVVHPVLVRRMEMQDSETFNLMAIIDDPLIALKKSMNDKIMKLPLYERGIASAKTRRQTIINSKKRNRLEAGLEDINEKNTACKSVKSQSIHKPESSTKYDSLRESPCKPMESVYLEKTHGLVTSKTDCLLLDEEYEEMDYRIDHPCNDIFSPHSVYDNPLSPIQMNAQTDDSDVSLDELPKAILNSDQLAQEREDLSNTEKAEQETDKELFDSTQSLRKTSDKLQNKALSSAQEISVSTAKTLQDQTIYGVAPEENLDAVSSLQKHTPESTTKPASPLNLMEGSSQVKSQEYKTKSIENTLYDSQKENQSDDISKLDIDDRIDIDIESDIIEHFQSKHKATTEELQAIKGQIEIIQADRIKLHVSYYYQLTLIIHTFFKKKKQENNIRRRHIYRPFLELLFTKLDEKNLLLPMLQNK
ncbi:ubiquitin carboxyl-terminal hydrolase [Spinellus fusiger]|nr:ubiquitin carboxyl-terminal hydrolase [Spinellus fusiger]